MRLPALLVLAACGGSSTPPAPAPTPPPAPSPAPESTPPSAPVASCTFTPPARSDASTRATFAQRHGDDWLIDTDKATGAVHHAGKPGPMPAQRAVAQADAEQQATAFLHTDHDLFGLTDADLVGATSLTRDTHTQWEIEWSASHPAPGLAKYPSMTRAWRLTIAVDDRGVTGAFARAPFPPEAPSCPPPKLDEAAARSAVIGQDLRFSSFGGQRSSSGTVTADKIGRVGLDYVETNPADHTVAFVYTIELDVERGSPMFEAYVDPYTGSVLRIFPLFST